MENDLACLNNVLIRGKPCVAMAVLHPAESVRLHQGNQANAQQRGAYLRMAAG